MSDLSDDEECRNAIQEIAETYRSLLSMRNEIRSEGRTMPFDMVSGVVKLHTKVIRYINGKEGPK